MHKYELEKQMNIHYAVKQGNIVKCNCGHEHEFIKGMVGRTIKCNKCEFYKVVITDRKAIKARGIYFNEDIQELFSAFYIVKNFKVEHFEQTQVTMNYTNDNIMQLNTLYNNMGTLSYSHRNDEHWRKPIPSLKNGTAQYGISTNINRFASSFEHWLKTETYWKSRNKYFKSKHLKALHCYGYTQYNSNVEKYYKDHDPFVIEKLINQYPEQLHWYMSDNFNLLNLNKAEIRFIVENKLSLEQAEVVSKLHKLNINRIDKWLKSERYEQTFNECYKELTTRSKDFVIKMPRTPQELEQEGKELDHCVGSYKNRHGKSTTIVFVRKAKEPDKPFVTCEFKNGKIKQYYTRHNKTPNDKALEFKSLLENELKEQIF